MADELTIFDLDLFEEMLGSLEEMGVAYTDAQADIIHKHMRILEQALADAEI
jgi:hypothetical protein